MRYLRLKNRLAGLLLAGMACVALLSVSGCGMSVKPSGQVVTEVSVGR